MDTVWGMVSDADTWEVLPGFKRSNCQAKIAEFEAAQKDVVDKNKDARTASGAAQTMARKVHAATVGYRTQGLASFPRGSAGWSQFNSLPTTTTTPKKKKEDKKQKV